MNWQFQYPQALWLLALIPFFILLYYTNKKWRDKAAKRIGEPRLVKELYKNYSPRKSSLKAFLIILVFACGCVALANPRKPDPLSGESRKGIDVLFALDVSNSMLAADVPPNRLEAARQLVLQLIDQFPDNRIGLVLFAGNAYLQMPLTFDHNAAQLYVSTASPAAISSQGTAIAAALKRCDLAFDKQSERFKTIILITDGETHDEDAVKTAKMLSANGEMINTVGIGSQQGATIMDSVTKIAKTDASGNIIVSKLNEVLLQQIAAATNGMYVHMDNVNGAKAALQRQLAQVDKKSLADLSQFNFETFYMWLAAPMLVLLIVDLFLSNRKKSSE